MEAVQVSYPNAVMSHDAGTSEPSERKVGQSLWRGLRGRCPSCGQGKMFYRYLKVNDKCPVCGEELFHQRADDAPPYVTIFIVGHIIGASILFAEDAWPNSPLWIHLVIWPILTIILSLVLLPMIKGALIAYQWALRMHGFDDAAEAEKAPAE